MLGVIFVEVLEIRRARREDDDRRQVECGRGEDRRPEALDIQIDRPQGCESINPGRRNCDENVECKQGGLRAQLVQGVRTNELAEAPECLCDRETKNEAVEGEE